MKEGVFCNLEFFLYAEHNLGTEQNFMTWDVPLVMAESTQTANRVEGLQRVWMIAVGATLRPLFSKSDTRFAVCVSIRGDLARFHYANVKSGELDTAGQIPGDGLWV